MCEMSVKICTSCSNCLAAPVKSCVCGGARYCDTGCQKNDWRRHKPSCPPYTVREVPGKGRGVVATRGLAVGTVVMTERPLMVYTEGKLRHGFNSLNQVGS